MQIDKFAVKQLPGIASLGLGDGDDKLRLCIVTEEIIGPVRNGGIASTYYHLSKGLAAQGHEVHVLFLKGPVVQDETPEHWIEHFASFGVTLHYLDTPQRAVWCSAPSWLPRYAAAYEWLKKQDRFDVVHTSEWRGGMFYALTAKRMGLAFEDTLFLVKTSSPHIWNRHYQMQPIEQRELVPAAYAEQRCVDLADIVIGGSAHLITFMEQIGYNVPETNVFVQPNIVDFSKVPVTDLRPQRKFGDWVRTRELVFFGRLEGRKGVELMCNALDILRERSIAPSKVTFLGKWGGPLATQDGIKVQDYLEEKAGHWDFPVEFITDKNQPEALSHICSRDMIAVMPSLIENSTMAVYEAFECKIPFVATRVGGTAELIDEKDHDNCLVPPTSTALADRLEKILENGQVIATPSFSNEENLDIWYRFHANLAQEIRQNGATQAIGDIVKTRVQRGAPIKTMDYRVLLRGEEDLGGLRDALLLERPDAVTIAYRSRSLKEDVEKVVTELTAAGLCASCFPRIGQAAGSVLDELAGLPGADGLVVAHGASALPRPGYFSAARKALEHRPKDMFLSFFRGENELFGMPAGSDVASQFFSNRALGPEIIALRPETYNKIGPFEPYDVQRGIIHEFIARASERHGCDLLVHPEYLLQWDEAVAEAKAMDGDKVYSYLKAKPIIDASSLAERKILLRSLALAGQGPAGFKDHMVRDGGRADEEPVWLIPADWNRGFHDRLMKRKLLVGLDETTNTFWLIARGKGERRLLLTRVPQALEHIKETRLPETGETITLSRFSLPKGYQAGQGIPVLWGMYDGETKLLNLFFRINTLASQTFSIAARAPILTEKTVVDVFDRYAALAAKGCGTTTDEAPHAGDKTGVGGLAETQNLDQPSLFRRAFHKARRLLKL